MLRREADLENDMERRDLASESTPYCDNFYVHDIFT